jgi:subtilisin family serine protease
MHCSRERGGIALTLSALAAALLAACGGGGSDTAAPTESAAAAKMPAEFTVPARSAPDASQRGSVRADAPEKASRLPESRLYIVQMIESPAVDYRGSIAGYATTKPVRGTKFDSTNPAVQKYVGYLKARHDAVLAKVGAANKKAYSYAYTFNGFSAELTDAQVEQLKATQGVVSVMKDSARKLTTTTTRNFLGLTGPGGFYATTQAKGENIVIGVVDTGIWPEHPSFAGEEGNASSNGTGAVRGYPRVRGWNGMCEAGENFPATMCNGKLIGARYYTAGIGGNQVVQKFLPWEFLSPRDFNGHGTHTASTAGGNENVPTTGLASVFGSIGGIAPRARIAAYKACWHVDGDGSCFQSDSVAAIDQAVADGVDVINFSVGGSTSNFLDAVSVAMLFAADAGVFVAASAGNSGPTASTVAHSGPWVTTVAAGTHDRDGKGAVVLGNGTRLEGASLANALSSRALVDAADVPAPGATAANAEWCVPGALNPAQVAGKIVLCKRGGGIALVDKTGAVAQAGGAGAVIYTDPAGASTTLALMHLIPTVHVVASAGATIKAYIDAAASPTASIEKAQFITIDAPFTAGFSSRGPLTAGGGDLLKPDVIAPGENIMAASAPPGTGGQLFDLKSGTSMSSPHVAGLAALLKEVHPGWSPMAIKSALMTTAYDVKDATTTAELIFRQGAGHVAPLKATDPGLVFEHGFTDWLGFMCGTGQLQASYCPLLRIDPSNLNVASIAIGDMAGEQTVKRTVKNVSGSPSSYNASASLPGFNVAITPAAFAIAAGGTQELTIKISRTDATANVYGGGHLTLADGSHNVRLPMVVRPVALAAPAEIMASGTSASYDVVFGYSGGFSATARGLIGSTKTADTVADDPTNGTCALTAPNAKVYTVAIPANTTYARFATFDSEVNAGSDVDLCVFDKDGNQVGASTTGTSAEAVNLVDPAAGDYRVVVHGWGVVGSTPFTLHRWLLGTTAAGNMTVTAPATATLAGTGTISLGFSNLTAGTRYLGSVAYAGAPGMPNPTIVRIDP